MFLIISSHERIDGHRTRRPVPFDNVLFVRTFVINARTKRYCFTRIFSNVSERYCLVGHIVYAPLFLCVCVCLDNPLLAVFGGLSFPLEW